MANPGTDDSRKMKVLVFSTKNISDPGRDLAGSSHMDYSTPVPVISTPCSSGINPSWIVHAIEAGFDGIFIAADGAECAYLQDCTGRTANIVERAQKMLEEKGMNPRRVKMAAICSVCSEPFVSHIENFQKALVKLSN